LLVCVATSDNQKWPISVPLELSCDSAMIEWIVQFNSQQFDNDKRFLSSHLSTLSCLGDSRMTFQNPIASFSLYLFQFLLSLSWLLPVLIFMLFKAFLSILFPVFLFYLTFVSNLVLIILIVVFFFISFYWFFFSILYLSIFFHLFLVFVLLIAYLFYFLNLVFQFNP
jgi:hypothetical protein